MNINFQNLYESVIGVTELDTKTLEQRCLKGTEELGELSEAILSYNGACGCEYKDKTMDDIKEEASDLLLVVLSVLAQTRTSEDELAAILKKKLEKWDLKVKGF